MREVGGERRAGVDLRAEPGDGVALRVASGDVLLVRLHRLEVRDAGPEQGDQHDDEGEQPLVGGRVLVDVVDVRGLELHVRHVSCLAKARTAAASHTTVATPVRASRSGRRRLIWARVSSTTAETSGTSKPSRRWLSSRRRLASRTVWVGSTWVWASVDGPQVEAQPPAHRACGRRWPRRRRCTRSGRGSWCRRPGRSGRRPAAPRPRPAASRAASSSPAAVKRSTCCSSTSAVTTAVAWAATRVRASWRAISSSAASCSWRTVSATDCRSKSVAYSPSWAERHVMTAPVTDTRPMSTAITSLRSTATPPNRAGAGRRRGRLPAGGAVPGPGRDGRVAHVIWMDASTSSKAASSSGSTRWTSATRPRPPATPAKTSRALPSQPSKRWRRPTNPATSSARGGEVGVALVGEVAAGDPGVEQRRRRRRRPRRA